jgi:hypothetical protein
MCSRGLGDFLRILICVARAIIRGYRSESAGTSATVLSVKRVAMLCCP